MCSVAVESLCYLELRSRLSFLKLMAKTVKGLLVELTNRICRNIIRVWERQTEVYSSNFNLEFQRNEMF